MSQQAIKWAWQCSAKSYQKLILLALADIADIEGQSCPSIQHLAQRCGIAPSTVRKHLKHLVTEKFISIQHRFDRHGHQITNRYQLRLKNDHFEIVQKIHPPDDKEPLKLVLNVLQDVERLVKTIMAVN